MVARGPAVNYDNLGLLTPGGVIEDGIRGVAGTPCMEPHPEYVRALNERVIRDDNGSYIVLGRDRPGSRISGYGGRGEHECSRIDMVVGRVAAAGWDAPPGTPGYPIGAVNENEEKIWVDPHFGKDAARIYISAKADIDQYFGLREGQVGMSQTRSAIGIKADAVRIIGREGIKLVTRPEPWNSQRGTVTYVKGIDLIAGNDDTDLQPMVKGESLVSALDAIVQWIGQMNNIVGTVVNVQQLLHTSLLAHTHLIAAPTPGMPTKPAVTDPIFASSIANLSRKLAIDGQISLMGHRVNGEFMKMGYLNPSGTKFILSRFNTTN